MVLSDGAVRRRLAPAGVADWHALSRTRFLGEAVEAGRLVSTTELAPDLLDHEVIEPFTFPYEWSFSMLVDAGLTHLDLVLAAMDEGMWTKDGSAYNVTFDGDRPVFVDVGSFTPVSAGPWPGYRQFCRHFLYPLMLTAATGVGFHRLLRSSVEGVSAEDLRRLLPARAKLSGAGLRNVVLPSVAERLTRRPSQAVADDLGSAGFSLDMAKAAVVRLRATLAGLDWDATSSWVDYRQTCTYSDDDRAAKAEFLASALAGGVDTVWDLGTNDGTYAVLASEYARRVVAMDSDHATVERLYQRLRGRRGNVVALVMDLTNPSPAQGWRGRERAALADRSRPDEVLALAVVHHLCLDAGIPLAEVVDWLASLAAGVVFEFVHPDDPMAAELLARKPAGTHDDYTVDSVEALLARHFDVAGRLALASGTRTLYRLRPR